MFGLLINVTCQRIATVYGTKFTSITNLNLSRGWLTNNKMIVKQRFSLNHPPRTSRPVDLHMKHKQPIFTPMSGFIMLIPIVTFCLGTWQVKRRQWKVNLIAELKSRSSAAPRDLPYDKYELENLEYYPIRVKGHFDHSKEIYLGPRSLIVDGEAATSSGLISQSQGGQSGFIVITPFHVEDRNMTILVNRGWVPLKYKNPQTRKGGQIEGVIELVGVVRLNEERAPFMPKNQHGDWFYRDLPKMAASVDAEPIYIDALASTSVAGGPIGGQTRISLRNEHLSYLITWYGLSAITSFMWYRQFVRKLPLM